MPVITPNNLNSEMLKEKILSGIPYDVPFIGKKMEQSTDLYEKNTILYATCISEWNGKA